MDDAGALANVVATNYLAWRGRQAAQRQMVAKLKSAVKQVLVYEDLDLQDKARGVIPVDRLHEEARERCTENNSDFHHELAKALLRWFKNEYFMWVNQPSCDGCNVLAEQRGTGPPTYEEQKYNCGVVELYQCGQCHQTIRFPRYNDPGKLMETRRGRCGEWANVFCLFCKAMGFDARYVLDLTDHVWTEIYHEGLGRWVNCDSCEGDGSYGQPLMYEVGWGKKLSYVFSFGPHDVVDVIRRYTRKLDDVMAHRTLVDEGWLKQVLSELRKERRATLSDTMRAELERRDQEEEEDLAAPREFDGELQGRQSGSLEWRVSRGEV